MGIGCLLNQLACIVACGHEVIDEAHPAGRRWFGTAEEDWVCASTDAGYRAVRNYARQRTLARYRREAGRNVDDPIGVDA